MDFLKDLTCPVCLEFYTFPIILPCSHVLCKSPCALNIFENDFIRCPVCRENSYVDGGMTNLPRVISIESIIDKVKAVLSKKNRCDVVVTELNCSDHRSETPRTLCDSKCISKSHAVCQHVANPNLTKDQSKQGTTGQSLASNSTDTPRVLPCCQQTLDSKLAWLRDKHLIRNSSSQVFTELDELHNRDDPGSYSDQQSSHWSADDEIQSILFSKSEQNNSTNFYFRPLEHIATHSSLSNNFESQQTMPDGPMESKESQTMNVRQSSKLTNGATRASSVQENSIVNSLKSSLDVIQVARVSSISIENSLADNRMSVTVPDLERLIIIDIEEQIEVLSDIQQQLLYYQLTYNYHINRLQMMLEKQRSAFNVECQILSSDVNVMRRDVISVAGLNTRPRAGEVSGLAKLTGRVLAGSPDTVRSLADDSVLSGNKNLPSIDVAEVDWSLLPNDVIELTNHNYEMANFDTTSPFAPKKPVIDIQRSSRNSDTVVLALTPQRKTISHYEIKFSSDEQKRLDIEESLLAHECTDHDITRYVIIENVCPSTNYYLSAIAWCHDVRGPCSDVVRCRTMSSRDCVVPVPVIVENLCRVTPTSALVHCVCPLEITLPDLSYTLMYRKEVTRGHNVWTGTAMETQEVHGIAGLCPDTDYQVVVLVTNSRGECQLSEKLLLRTKTQSQTPPHPHTY